jgi:hypothetical protein
MAETASSATAATEKCLRILGMSGSFFECSNGGGHRCGPIWSFAAARVGCHIHYTARHVRRGASVGLYETRHETVPEIRFPAE